MNYFILFFGITKTASSFSITKNNSKMQNEKRSKEASVEVSDPIENTSAKNLRIKTLLSQQPLKTRKKKILAQIDSRLASTRHVETGILPE